MSIFCAVDMLVFVCASINYGIKQLHNDLGRPWWKVL